MKTQLKDFVLKHYVLVVSVLIFIPYKVNAFVEQWKYTAYEPAGFFSGIWHGLLAPWSLIARWFFDVGMYAYANTGWFYDFGFLIGAVFSIPVGWAAAILSTLGHIFF